MAYENKMIIHNVAKLPDDVALEMVLRTIRKGRADSHLVYHGKKFEDCVFNERTFSGKYHVDCRKPNKQSETDVFFITKEK